LRGIDPRRYPEGMRGVTASLCGIVLTLGIAATAHATLPEQCGDANDDGDKTVTDGVLALRSAADLNGGCTVVSRCDVNGDAQITVTDGVQILRIAAGLPVDLACRHITFDRSEFNVFTFDQRSAFGFCPKLDSVSSFVLLERPEGFLLDAKVFVAGAEGDPDCIPEVTTSCVREITLPSRTLTADELARVRTAFSAIVREQQQSPDCKRGVSFDPCLINELRWDNSAITDFACGEPRLLPDQMAALVALFDSLAPAP
jgi:hypothetical protein